MNAKASTPFDLILWGAPGDAGLGSISVGTQWNEYTVEFTPKANYENFVLLQVNWAVNWTSSL